MIYQPIAFDGLSLLDDLTNEFEHNGIELESLTTIYGSHLANVAAGPSSKIIRGDDENLSPRKILDLSCASSTDGSEKDTHSIIQAEMAEALRNSIDNSYDFAINHAKPLIADVFSKAKEFTDVTKKDFEDDDKSLEIVKDALHPILDDSVFINELESVADNVSFLVCTKTNLVTGIDPILFFDSIKTGYDGIDQHIDDLFASDGLYWSLREVLDGNTNNNMNDNIIRYYAAKFLRDHHADVIDFYSEIKADDFSKNMQDAVAHYAYNILTDVQKRDKLIQSQQLVKDISRYNDDKYVRITVIPEVYNQWIEAGGSAQALYGFVIDSDASFIGYDKLLENAKFYEGVFRTFSAAESARREESRARRLGGYLKQLVKRAVEENWEEFSESRYADSYGKMEFLSKLTEVDYAGISDARLYMIVRDTLSQILWPKSSALIILKSIDRVYGLMGDQGDIQTAVEISKIQHLADIISAQISVNIKE